MDASFFGFFFFLGYLVIHSAKKQTQKKLDQTVSTDTRIWGCRRLEMVKEVPKEKVK